MNNKTLCSNISDITEALHVFQKNMQEMADSNEKVKTSKGYADVSAGYEITDIGTSDFGVTFEVMMLDRSIRENDCTRNGDSAVFHIGFEEFAEKRAENSRGNENRKSKKNTEIER